MLLNDKWFENNTSFDCLFSKFSVQNDAMVCISDGRKWGAKYFKELSEKYGEKRQSKLVLFSNHLSFNNIYFHASYAFIPFAYVCSSLASIILIALSTIFLSL